MNNFNKQSTTNNTSNNNNNKSGYNSKFNLFNKNTFTTHIDDIKSHWENLSKKYDIINDDIKESERMFNMYDDKEFFYKLKEILEYEKNKVKEEIINIENEILNLKHNYF